MPQESKGQEHDGGGDQGTVHAITRRDLTPADACMKGPREQADPPGDNNGRAGWLAWTARDNFDGVWDGPVADNGIEAGRGVPPCADDWLTVESRSGASRHSRRRRRRRRRAR